MRTSNDMRPHHLAPLNSIFFHSRVLTMEWIEGVKLTTLAPEEIQDLVKVGQEAFLIQLLEVSAEVEGWARSWRGFLGKLTLDRTPLCPHLTAFRLFCIRVIPTGRLLPWRSSPRYVGV